mgnify:FL=1
MSDTNMTEKLNGLLADATVLYYKLHHYHWNLRGPSFFTLHEKFEELYNEWGEQVDVLAERVLQIGGRPLPSLASALQKTALHEESELPDADEMVKRTLADLQKARARMQEVITAAQEHEDRTTENTLDDFIDRSAKNIWMLAAYLGKSVNEI